MRNCIGLVIMIMIIIVLDNNSNTNTNSIYITVVLEEKIDKPICVKCIY